MNVLICGKGEIGRGMGELLEGSEYSVSYADPELNVVPPPDLKADIVHVCFPIKNKGDFDRYKRYCNPFTVVVIDATVPIDLPAEIQSDVGYQMLVIHSPVRAAHPNIAEGLLKYVKMVGAADPARRDEAKAFCKEYFLPLGIQTKVLTSARETAAGKLWDTTWYLTQIILCNQVAVYCAANRLNFGDVYTAFQDTADTGKVRYVDDRALIYEHFPRPVMLPGGIGGHCLLPNLELLKADVSPAFYSWVTQMDHYFKRNKALQEYFKTKTGIPPVVHGES